jgi:hypothetical protein
MPKRLKSVRHETDCGLFMFPAALSLVLTTCFYDKRSYGSTRFAARPVTPVTPGLRRNVCIGLPRRQAFH